MAWWAWFALGSLAGGLSTGVCTILLVRTLTRRSQ